MPCSWLIQLFACFSLSSYLRLCELLIELVIVTIDAVSPSNRESRIYSLLFNCINIITRTLHSGKYIDYIKYYSVAERVFTRTIDEVNDCNEMTEESQHQHTLASLRCKCCR